MAHLTLAGVSEDGKRLLLLDDAGVEHTVTIDARLRAALRGDTARLGQLEIQMDSTLRPRDIQARIRAGESPESVAQAATTTVEKIMPFAGPVLAERQHVAERAQRSTVRRRSGGDATGARTLGDAVAARLRPVNVDPSSVEWDAWRREDGRWTLVGVFESPTRAGIAHFTFDAPGNYVVLDDEDARWLVGDLADPAPQAHAEAHDDLERARRRRQAGGAPADQLPLGDDAIELVTGDTTTAGAPAEAPVQAFLDETPGVDESELSEEAADAAALDTDPQPEPQPEPQPAAADEPPARRSVRKRGGRASVPSWDEIMFGGGKQE